MYVLDRSTKKFNIKNISVFEYDIVDSNGRNSILKYIVGGSYWMTVPLKDDTVDFYPMIKEEAQEGDA